MCLAQGGRIAQPIYWRKLPSETLATHRHHPARVLLTTHLAQAAPVADASCAGQSREHGASWLLQPHTTPDGDTPNELVRRAGYVLPSYYPTKGNMVESIAAGYASADECWAAWMDSASHSAHVLALDSFYCDQTNVGVGYFHSAKSHYVHYWCVISAPEEM